MCRLRAEGYIGRVIHRDGKERAGPANQPSGLSAAAAQSVARDAWRHKAGTKRGLEPAGSIGFLARIPVTASLN